MSQMVSNIEIDTWYEIAGMEGQTLNDNNEEQEKDVNINEKRLQYFSKDYQKENDIIHLY